MKTAYGYSFYGLLGAPIPRGLGFSRGMDVLTGKARALGVIAEPRSYGYTEWERVAEKIVNQQQMSPNALFFLWGHSFGANCLTWIANYVAIKGGRKIDYLAGYDPSMTTLTDRSYPLERFRYAVCFRGRGLSIAGHETWTVKKGENGSLVIVDAPESHTDIDDGEGYHGRSLKTMRTLMTQGVKQ